MGVGYANGRCAVCLVLHNFFICIDSLKKGSHLYLAFSCWLWKGALWASGILLQSQHFNLPASLSIRICIWQHLDGWHSVQCEKLYVGPQLSHLSNWLSRDFFHLIVAVFSYCTQSNFIHVLFYFHFFIFETESYLLCSPAWPQTYTNLLSFEW